MGTSDETKKLVDLKSREPIIVSVKIDKSYINLNRASPKVKKQGKKIKTSK